MKKIMIVFAILFATGKLYAQSPSRQAIFMEVLGNGFTYSFNYDTRFFHQNSGLGMRAGIGYLGVDNYQLTTFPIMINYLLGKEKHYFEMGVGTTLTRASKKSNFGPVGTREKGTSFIGTMSFGYRLVPKKGGFLFRAGITPLFDRTSFFPFWPQISFGYAF